MVRYRLSDRELAREFAPAQQMLDFFSETIAPYPYQKLALIVGATQFGGMENSSAIVFARNVLGPRQNPRVSRTFDINGALEEVVAHEIAHQDVYAARRHEYSGRSAADWRRGPPFDC